MDYLLNQCEACNSEHDFDDNSQSLRNFQNPNLNVMRELCWPLIGCQSQHGLSQRLP